MIIYFDSGVIIYLYDHTGSFHTRALARLQAAEQAGDTTAVSDLSRLECRVGPMLAKDAAKLAVFDSFFARSDVIKVPITTAVFDRATLLRATYRFKTADALNLAAAIEGGCDCFLTNDVKLKACTDLPVELLP